MMDMDDDTLTAMALREHAQTCEDIAARAVPGSEGCKAWSKRAERCRQLARQHETAAKVLRGVAGQCICGDAMQAIGEHREGCPKRGRA